MKKASAVLELQQETLRKYSSSNIKPLQDVIWNSVVLVPVSEKNEVKTDCVLRGDCDDCRNGKRLEKTLEELDFLSVNLELELGCGFWGCVVGFFKTEKRCQCEELILFLP